MIARPILLALAFALTAAPAAHAAGFPEPPVTFYGTVNQTADGYTIPVTAGTIHWTIAPPTGSSVLVSAPLSPVSGQGLYRLKIPVEKVPAGFTVTSNTLNAPTSSTTYGRGTVTLNGNTPLSITFPVGAGAGNFSFAEIGRGKTDHVDLVLTAPFTDSDNDGLPDWFEDKYGLDKYNPADAAEARDQYGRLYADDYRNHVDPRVVSEFQQWALNRQVPGAPNAPTDGDPDSDGLNSLLEFALETDPKAPDASLAHQRLIHGVTTVAGKRYLTLTVIKPAAPRTSLVYAVESSGDLQTWASVANTDVVTITDNSGTLQVRDAKSVDDAASARRFLRLRVVLTQP